MNISLIIDNIWVFITGIISGVIIVILSTIIIEMIPITSDLRFKINFFRKKLCKWIKNESIKAELNIKFMDLKDEYDPEIIKKRIKKSLNESKMDFYEKDNDLFYKFKYGNTEIDALICFAWYPSDDEENKKILSQIETTLSSNIKYKKFDGHILDITQGSNKLEDIIRNILPKINLQYNLIFELKNLYELTGVLSKANLDVLVAKDKNYEIEMFSNKVVTYGEITQELTSTMKDLIVIYN